MPQFTNAAFTNNNNNNNEFGKFGGSAGGALPVANDPFASLL